MAFENLAETTEVVEEFRKRARELRDQVADAEPSRALMLTTLARDYERRARSLELYVESVHDAPRSQDGSDWALAITVPPLLPSRRS